MLYSNAVGDFDIAHNDRVYFNDAYGNLKKGKANGLLMYPDHLVLDMGGRYGTPCVVPRDRIVKVSKRRAA